MAKARKGRSGGRDRNGRDRDGRDREGPDREGRTPPEGYRETGEDLRRKGEWFRLGRTDATDMPLGRLREAALAQAGRLGSLDLGSFVGPAGKPVGRGGVELIGPDRRLPASAAPVDNPAPGAALFLAGTVAEVRPARKGAEAEVAGLYLRLALDRAALDRLVPETIRICRWEPATRRWVLVPRSGAHPGDAAAWAILHRPGIYAPVGLPADPRAFRSLLLLNAARPLLRAARGAEDIAAVRQALFGEGGFAALAERFRDPDLFPPGTAAEREDAGGAPPAPRRPRRGGAPPGGLPLRGGFGGLPGLPDLPDLPGLDGLPEFEILDDICPPWRGKRFPWQDLLPVKIPDLPIWPWPVRWLGWVSAGPVNVNGRIKSLAVSPGNRNLVYAGAADGGVWKTLNAGLFWFPLMFTELSMAIGSIAVAPSDPGVVYAATGEDTPGWGPSYPGVGVYRSADAGATWTLRGQGVVGDRCSRIAVDGANADRVFLASNTGLWRTLDGGASWVRVLAGHICDLLLDPVEGNRLWAAIHLDGVWQSADGGASWQRSGQGRLIRFGSFQFLIGRLPTGPAVEWIKLAQGLNGAGGRNLLLAKMGTDSGDVWRSSDGGTSWFRVASGVQPASYNEWTNMIAVNPANHDVVLAGGVGLSRAADGKSFAGIGGTHSDHHQVVFDPVDPDFCWIATDGGVYRSVDAGATWNLLSHRLAAAQFYSIGVSQTGAFLLGAGTQDQGIVATDGPTQWRDTHAGNEGGFFVVDPNDSRNAYACPWSADLVRSTDGAFTWTAIRNGMTETAGGVTVGPAQVRHIAVQPGNGSVLLAAGRLDFGPRLYRSTDRGNSWTRVLIPASEVLRVAFAPSDGARAFAGATVGRLYRSDGGGIAGSWFEPSAAGPGGFNGITALAVDWSDRDIVWIGCGGFSGPRVRRSEDGGSTWADATGVLPADQLPALPVNALVVDQHNPDTVYVANDIGVFRTRDRGVSWENFSDGFLDQDVPRIIVTGLELRRATNTLYAGTMGRGAYRRGL
jgi:photosystem II stability/assembly factor-like uncharacterized protein